MPKIPLVHTIATEGEFEAIRITKEGGIYLDVTLTLKDGSTQTVHVQASKGELRTLEVDVDALLTRFAKVGLALGRDGGGNPFLADPGESLPAGVVTATPAPINAAVGVQATITPTVKDVNGKTVNDRTPTYRSTDEAVAMVDAAGVVTALAPGQASIVVQSDNAAAEVPVTVA